MTHGGYEDESWWHIWLFLSHDRDDEDIMYGVIIASWNPGNLFHRGEIYCGLEGNLIKL